jgi:predicted flap endonuclease-1-like 5' DNA nuclease
LTIVYLRAHEASYGVSIVPKIIDVEGIGPVNSKKLEEIGVMTTDDLLMRGTTADAREELSTKAGIAPKLILEWVNLADLYRIKGVGQEYSDLLEEAGVDTVAELAKRVPENLHAKMLEVNGVKKLVNRPPPLSVVKDWVEQAKKLKRVVEY